MKDFDLNVAKLGYDLEVNPQVFWVEIVRRFMLVNLRTVFGFSFEDLVKIRGTLIARDQTLDEFLEESNHK
jgi:hypothetical protein